MSSVRRRSSKRKVDIGLHPGDRMNGVLYDGRSRMEADTHANRFFQSVKRLVKKTAHGTGVLIRMPVELVQRLQFNHQVGRRNKKLDQESVLQGKVPYYKPQLNLSGEKKSRPVRLQRTQVHKQQRLEKQLREEEELADRIRHAQQQMQRQTVQESEKELDFRPLYAQEPAMSDAQEPVQPPLRNDEEKEMGKVLPLHRKEEEKQPRTDEEQTQEDIPQVQELMEEQPAAAEQAAVLPEPVVQTDDSSVAGDESEAVVLTQQADESEAAKAVPFTSRLRKNQKDKKSKQRPTGTDGTDGTGGRTPAPLGLWKKCVLSVLAFFSLCGIGYGGWYFFEGRYCIVTINDDGAISQVRTAQKEADAILAEAQFTIDADDLVTMTKVVTAQEQADAANQAAEEEPQLTEEELAGEAEQEQSGNQAAPTEDAAQSAEPSQTPQATDIVDTVQTEQTDGQETTEVFTAAMFEDKVVAAELTEEVDDGYTIVIQRARNMTVTVEGEESTPVRLAVGTVEDALAKSGVAYDQDDAISPGLDTPIEEGLDIHIKRAFDVSVKTMKETIPVRIAEGTVADALKKAGITYSASDELSPSADTQLTAGMQIQLTTVEVKYEEKTYAVAFKTIEQKSNKVNRGTKKVSRQGKEGVRTVKERVTYKNGVETGRAVVSDKITTPAVNKIVLVGTRAPVNPAIDDLPAGGPSSSMIKKTVVVDQITAYTHTGRKTATGKWPMIGMCAVNTKQFAFGTKFYIPGYGYAVAEDTGSNTSSKVCIDVFMDTKADCTRWGRKRNVKVYVLK